MWGIVIHRQVFFIYLFFKSVQSGINMDMQTGAQDLALEILASLKDNGLLMFSFLVL